ncbi:MAG: hypothetical protein ACR2PT_18615 [Endozoicomonas sp.]
MPSDSRLLPETTRFYATAGAAYEISGLTSAGSLDCYHWSLIQAQGCELRTMTDLLVLLLIATTLAGFLIVPWLTPLTAALLLLYSYIKHRIRQSPVTCLISFYGIISPALWFIESMDVIEHIFGSPQLYILPQAILLFLAIREQQQFNLAGYMKASIGLTLGLSAFALYIMAFAAFFSAGV